MSTINVTTLDNVADGAAQELFAYELAKIAENIADENTGALAKRSITLKFEFQPDESREEVKCSVSIESKIAPIRGHGKTIHMGKSNGKPALYTSDTKQTDMFDDGVTRFAPREANHA